ncbi:hypothetical protein Tco_0573077 [Tanacetum coccineum]
MRDLPRDIPLDSVVVLRYEKRSKSENKGRVQTEMELVLEQTQHGTSYEVSSDTKVIHNDDGNPSRANIKQALGRFNTTAGNPVKEILLKLNLPDHRLSSTGSEDGIKVKKISEKDGYSSFQDKERYEHVGPKVTSSQEGKRSQDDKRLDLADDLKEALDHMQVKLKGTSLSLKSKDHYNISQDKDNRNQVTSKD